MRILVVSNNYPSNEIPSRGTFVYKLVQKFSDQGHTVIVISPTNIMNIFKKKNNYGVENAIVYRPKVLSLSNKNIFFFNTYLITHLMQVLAVKRTINNNNLQYDVIYCHFFRNAFIAINAIPNSKKPLIVAVGENKGIETTIKCIGRRMFIGFLKRINGYIAVSQVVKEKLLSLHIPKEKIITKQNAVDLSVFKKLDKKICREKHGFEKHSFIIVFVGNFIKSKGPDILLESIKGLEEIKVIFIGGGPIKLESDQIIYKQRVASNAVPELLNCADVFVLPTKHEGSNNAIIEAMACGLPIISSNIEEIKAQCKPSFSILIDPENVTSIRNAIIKLYKNNTLREEMAKNALIHSKKFDLNLRAKSILEYLQMQL